MYFMKNEKGSKNTKYTATPKSQMEAGDEFQEPKGVPMPPETEMTPPQFG
jgi:hypothetical protein